MDYIVSARKYRPATFATVVGQRALTTTLLNAIHTGHLAHAYLFCGPRGVGKTTCARIFAKTINCLNPTPQGEACCRCESCQSFEQGRSMNIHELDAASNNSVEDIRELIEQVRIPPQGGRYKVFIIDEVHMLSTQAFNAFLKTLEEPPSYVVFILATTEKHKILPTILSRCQVYDFQRISLQMTVDHLQWVASQEGIEAEPQALHLIARKADGGMRDALSIFDQMASFTQGHITLQSTLDNLNMLSSDYYFRLTDQLLQRRITDSLLLLDEVLGKGFDGATFMGGLASHLRDLLVAKDAATLPLLETDEQTRRQYQAQAAQCPMPFLYHAMRLCSQCEGQYRQSHNKRLGLELCLIQVAQLQDEPAGNGLRPTKILKPAFPDAAPGAVVEVKERTETYRRTEKTEAPENDKVTEVSAPSERPRKRAAGLMSIARMTQGECLVQTENTANLSAEPIADRQQRLLSDELLQEAWTIFLNALPQSEDATRSRLLPLRQQLRVKDAKEAVFVVETPNSLLTDMLCKMRAKIESAVISLTATPSAHMEVEEHKAPLRQFLTPSQQLERMQTRYPSVALLVKELNLTL